MKKYPLNFNYVILFYDVKQNRVHKVFKVCKKYLSHYQNSVFRGAITMANYLKLKKEIEKIIDENYDFVTFVLTISESSFFEESLGVWKKDTESAII